MSLLDRLFNAFPSYDETDIDLGAVAFTEGDDTVAVRNSLVIDDDFEDRFSALTLEDVGPIDTLAGDDRLSVLFDVEVTENGGDSDLSGMLVNADLSLGDGNDQVDGMLSIVAPGDISGAAISVDEGAVLDTGRGSDYVHGTTVVEVDTDVRGVNGIRIEDGSTLLTGAGGDQIIGEAYLTKTGDTTDFAAANGINGGTLDTGSGNDVLRGIAFASGQNVLTDGFDATGDVFEISTGGGDDRIEALSGAIGDDASADGIDDSQVSTGTGDDVITAHAGALGDTVSANGIVDSVITTGSGDDFVFATGTALGDRSYGYGLSQSTIELGDGDDHLIAVGSDDGIRDVDIFGGNGNDVFDLQSFADGEGRNSVDGGEGYDELILSGDSDMFDFGLVDASTASGSIFDGAEVLHITGVEVFHFDDGSFLFHDLFFA